MRIVVGRVAALKAGGPRLTVVESMGGGLVRCGWFTGGSLVSAWKWCECTVHEAALDFGDAK